MTGLRRSIVVPGLLVVLVAGAALFAAFGQRGAVPPPSGVASAAEPSTERVITVSGEGRVLVKPDTAQTTLGVEILNADLGAAQQEADEKINAIIEALKAQGVSDDQIKTANYSIYAERDHEKLDQVSIRGYRVSHLLQVKVKPVDKIGEVIDAAVAAGANVVHDVGFAVEDREGAVAQARELAVQNAKQKAEQLAGAAGVGIGVPVKITESSSTAPPPMPYDVAVEETRGQAAPIQHGESEVVVVVTVSYAIE